MEERHRRSARRASARTTRGRPYSADPELGLVYIPVGMPLMRRVRRPSSRRQPVRQQPRRARREDRQAASGTSRWSITTSGTTTRRWRRTCSTSRSTGKPRKVVAQTTKQGWIYMFDRVTGEPIWPMPETPVLQSDVPGERRRRRSRFRSKPAPYAQQGLDRSGPHRLHAGDQGCGAASSRSGAAWGRTTFPPSAMDGNERPSLFVVRAGRERRREHRRRRRGRSRDGPDLRRLADRAEHDGGRQGSLLGVRLQQAGADGRGTAAASSARRRRRRATCRRRAARSPSQAAAAAPRHRRATRRRRPGRPRSGASRS